MTLLSALNIHQQFLSLGNFPLAPIHGQVHGPPPLDPCSLPAPFLPLLADRPLDSFPQFIEPRLGSHLASPTPPSQAGGNAPEASPKCRNSFMPAGENHSGLCPSHPLLPSLLSSIETLALEKGPASARATVSLFVRGHRGPGWRPGSPNAKEHVSGSWGTEPRDGDA